MAGDRHDMSDAEWEILRPALPDGRPGRARKNDREGDGRHLPHSSERCAVE